MNTTEALLEQYELVEGDLRKLDELVGQLAVWSDEYTYNHKKEEERLAQYLELHENLEETKQIVETNMADLLGMDDIDTDRFASYEATRLEKLKNYVPIEETIHQWLGDIKDIHVLIAKNEIISKYRSYIDEILTNRNVK